MQRYEDDYDQVGLDLSAEGFYRITAVTRVADAKELNGLAGSFTEVRKFDLDLRSNSIVIRHTAAGFVPVDVTTTKQASSK